MRSGLDVVTGGNKALVNDLTGGLMDSAEGAARGNSKDIIKTGLTGVGVVMGANAIGGLMNPTPAPINATGVSSLVGGSSSMGFLDNIDFGGILTNLVNSKINPQTSQGNGLSAQQVQMQNSLAQTEQQNKMLMIGLGVLGVVGLAFALKR